MPRKKTRSVSLGMLSSVLTDFAIYEVIFMCDSASWLCLEETIKKSQKNYAHFDLRTDISKCGKYISNQVLVAKHGFYPFIHYTKETVKYNKREGRKIKIRDICYAAHIDRCIYQMYSHIINDMYNKELKKRGIDYVPVAYRTDLGVSNVELAKRAFDFIKESKTCFVMIGDFTSFFDNLDHKYLKERWCNLLGTDLLPDDHYAVFKNITKFSKWELSDIYEINGLEENKYSWKKLNSMSRVLTTKQFHEYHSHIIKNKNPYGIPQGSPISAVLANLYMIDIDKSIYDIVCSYNGLYMRYSDDFIIVVPQTNLEYPNRVMETINSLFNSVAGLTLEPNKTQYYNYKDNQITNFSYLGIENDSKNKKIIDFLGFSFGGRKVAIRQRTISRYYSKMYQKIKTIRKNNGYTRKGNKISNENLYKHYSIKGIHGGNGNFLTYVKRAKSCFGNNENIEISTKNHMQKISKALKSKNRK